VRAESCSKCTSATLAVPGATMRMVIAALEVAGALAWS
jgi:hypothetical protein